MTRVNKFHFTKDPELYAKDKKIPSKEPGFQGLKPDSAIILAGKGFPVWYESTQERLKRALSSYGIKNFIEQHSAVLDDRSVIVVRPDVVIDGPALQALVETPNVILQSTNPDCLEPVAAHVSANSAKDAIQCLSAGVEPSSNEILRTVTTGELGANYLQALRKRQVPYALLISEQTLKAIEWRMFMGTYKGATDFVTKWVWPRPSFPVTKLCARLGISPNQITSLSLVLVMAAMYWFYQADYITGLIAAWIMTFLDTVDGKLARITLNSSKFGNIFDHSIDLIHPPFWYIAWGYGVWVSSDLLSKNEVILILIVIVVGYVLQRILEGIAIGWFKIEIHVWRPIDTLFRQITARRNPNLVLLMACTLVGWPDWGLVTVAVWTAICLVLHVIQIIQAAIVLKRDGQLVSWMAIRA